MSLPGGPPDAPSTSPATPIPATEPESTPSTQLPPDIIPGVLPAAQIHLFSGAPGSGKTPIIAQFVAAVSSAQNFLGQPTLATRTPAFIGVLASDRIWRDQGYWYSMVGLPDIPHYSLTDDLDNVSGKKLRNTKKSDRFDLFCTVLERLHPPDGPPHDSLIIVDPISLFLGGNLMDYDKVFSYMLDLNQYCFRNGVTLIGLAHIGKQRGDPKQKYTRPQDRIVGTTAQTGCAGTSLYIAPPAETGEGWHEFGWVPRTAAAASIRLTQDPENGLFFSCAEVDIAPTKRGRRSLEKAQAFLELLPKDGSEISVKALCDLAESALEIGKAMVYRYLAQLEADGLVEQGSDRATRRRKLKLPN